MGFVLCLVFWRLRALFLFDCYIPFKGKRLDECYSPGGKLIFAAFESNL